MIHKSDVMNEKEKIISDYNYFINKLNLISKLPLIKIVFSILIPTFGVLYLHRKSKIHHLKGNKIRSKLYYLLNYYSNHIDINPQASIGYNVYFPHPIGIVIGANVLIGNHVVILSCTTFGTNSAETRSNYGYPIIEDNCYIGTGAKIIGDITIGKKSIVGANAVVINSFAAHSKIIGVPGRTLKK